MKTFLSLLVALCLPAAPIPVGAAEPARACPAASFLPGGDGCLGPGFNTRPLKLAPQQLASLWASLPAATARERAQALLQAAPADCLLNEAALRVALQATAEAMLRPPPMPQIADKPACDSLQWPLWADMRQRQ